MELVRAAICSVGLACPDRPNVSTGFVTWLGAPAPHRSLHRVFDHPELDEARFGRQPPEAVRMALGHVRSWGGFHEPLDQEACLRELSSQLSERHAPCGDFPAGASSLRDGFDGEVRASQPVPVRGGVVSAHHQHPVGPEHSANLAQKARTIVEVVIHQGG